MARPKHEGLYTSVSQVKTYLRCPRQFELKYVRGVPAAFLPAPLVFGSAFHSALAAYYGEMEVSGMPLRRDHVLDVFRTEWARALDGPVPLQVDEEEDAATSLVDKGVSMLHAFVEHAEKNLEGVTVEAVESSFAVVIHDPDSGEPLEEQLVGTMDLVVLDHGQRVVVEHKTSAKKYSADQLRYDLQLTGYKIAARQAGMGDVGLRFQVITKAKVPAVQVVDVARDDQDEEDFVRTAVGVLRAIDAGVSYPVRSTWMCRSCQYAHACAGARS
ncbi:MAG: PD-(D/E)XK nuclease family protein [Deltaproteobacteria bacterium]|nr:PD-(D/E)XK nuclease family protein [Deltaproteobacteria bacterium]